MQQVMSPFFGLFRRLSLNASPRALTRNTSLAEGTTEWRELSEQVDATIERTDTAMAQEWCACQIDIVNDHKL